MMFNVAKRAGVMCSRASAAVKSATASARLTSVRTFGADTAVPYISSTPSTMGGEKKDWVNEDTNMKDLPGLNREQLMKIRDADHFYRSKHLDIEADMDVKTRDSVRRKRMIYRSKQRGWLEADLLLGSWAVKNVPTLTDDELDQYELLLKEETIDIYNYVSGKDTLPPHLANLPVMKKVMQYALQRDMMGPDSYAKMKRETNLT